MRHCRKGLTHVGGILAVLLLAVCCTLPKGGDNGGGGNDRPPLPDRPWKDRLIAWSTAGVWADGVKGIPNRTTVSEPLV